MIHVTLDILFLDTLSVTSTIIIGLLAGYIYGLFFVQTQKRAFSSLSNSRYSTLLYSCRILAARIVLISLGCFYILRLPKIHFILLLISFVITFWIAILLKRPTNDRAGNSYHTWSVPCSFYRINASLFHY